MDIKKENTPLWNKNTDGKEKLKTIQIVSKDYTSDDNAHSVSSSKEKSKESISSQKLDSDDDSFHSSLADLDKIED